MTDSLIVPCRPVSLQLHDRLFPSILQCRQSIKFNCLCYQSAVSSTSSLSLPRSLIAGLSAVELITSSVSLSPPLEPSTARYGSLLDQRNTSTSLFANVYTAHIPGMRMRNRMFRVYVTGHIISRDVIIKFAHGYYIVYVGLAQARPNDWLEEVETMVSLARNMSLATHSSVMIILLATVTCSWSFRALNLESHINHLHSKCFALPA